MRYTSGYIGVDPSYSQKQPLNHGVECDPPTSIDEATRQMASMVAEIAQTVEALHEVCFGPPPAVPTTGAALSTVPSGMFARVKADLAATNARFHVTMSRLTELRNHLGA